MVDLASCYHAYQTLWSAQIGDCFIVLHELGNTYLNRQAMVVYPDEEQGAVVVGHLPREI